MSRPRSAHLLPLGLLLFATLIFFWPLLLGGNWHIPQGGGDLVSFLWPTYRFAANTIIQGDLPLWNPYLYAGAPYAADNQSGLFYPVNLALTLLPDLPYRAMEWLVVLHIFMGGAGMYVLLLHTTHYTYQKADRDRSHTTKWAGVTAALAFQFSSVFVTHVGNLNIVATSSYLPWALFCLHRMSQEYRIRWAGGLGICLALAILAGHAQMAFIVGVAVGLASLWELSALVRSDLSKALRITLLLALALGIALGLTAIALLPAVEMTQYTHRAYLSYDAAARYSIPPNGLVGMLSPLLFGRGASGFWPAWDRVELGYGGTVTLLLAGMAVGNTRTRRFAYLLGSIGLLIALGKHTPLHLWLYDHAPGFGQLRVPARFILLTNFAVAYLAGQGMQDLTLRIVPARRVLVWGATLALIAALAMPMVWGEAAKEVSSPPPEALPLAILVTLLTLGLALVISKQRWYAPGLTLLLGAELIGLGAWVEVDRFEPNEGYRSSPAVEFLLSQPGPFRIDVAASTWQPDAPAIHGLESVSGLHNPLALADYDTYYWSVGYRGSALYNFLNVRFVVADKDIPAADSSFVPVFNEDPHVDVYLNTNARPRITLIHNPVLVPDQDAAFASIHQPDFDPYQDVVLEGGVPLRSPTAGDTKMYYTQYTPHQHTIVASTPSPAYLVFSEVWYPGWQASINGQAAEIIRANYAFRAVYLPSGEHTVVMHFKPRSWHIGIAVTLVTIVAMLVFGSLHLLRAHKPN